MYKRTIENSLGSLVKHNYDRNKTTGRSTKGMIYISAGGAIFWYFQRQPSVAIPCTKTKIIAISEDFRKRPWFHDLYENVLDI